MYGTEFEDIVFKPSTFSNSIVLDSRVLEGVPTSVAAGVASFAEIGRLSVVIGALYCCIVDRVEVG